MAQIEDIKLKIEQGLSDRQIAKAVGRRRALIAEIRSGELKSIPAEKFPYLKNEFIPTKEYIAGEKSEVDWAGDAIEWLDTATSKINKSYVFVGCLCYSQLLFAKT